MDEPRQRTSFSLLRRWGIAFNVVLSAAALLAIVVMLNYLASRHHSRVEWSTLDRPGLTPFTRQLLLSLTNDIRVTVFFDPEEAGLFSDVKDLLLRYEEASRHLKLEFVNYARSKGRAEYLLNQYRLAASPDTLLVVFEAAGRPPRVVRERELSEYDVRAALKGEPIRRVAFKGESVFSEALLGLADTRPFRAAYLTGHGEADPADEDGLEGYHAFARLLAEKNIELHPISLRTNGVPADCQVLIVAGPRSLVPPDELQKIDQYLRAGGRAFILLLSPARGARRTGLDRLLSPWGIEVGENLVIDRAESQAGDVMLYASHLGNHPVMRPLEGLRLGLAMPCAVWPRPEPGARGDAAQPEVLVSTSPKGVVVTDLRSGQGTVQTNGSIPLAVAVERGAIAGVSPDRGATRVIVVGDASMFGNQLIELEANRDFASLAANWLLDRRQLLEIPPRPAVEYRINLTRRQMHAAAWLLLGALPGGMLALGLVVWIRRRK